MKRQIPHPISDIKRLDKKRKRNGILDLDPGSRKYKTLFHFGIPRQLLCLPNFRREEVAGHTGYRAGLLETEYPWGFNVSYILTLVSAVYALSARHKKKPRNNKIKAVNPKETPMAIWSSFSRFPTNGKEAVK